MCGFKKIAVPVTCKRHFHRPCFQKDPEAYIIQQSITDQELTPILLVDISPYKSVNGGGGGELPIHSLNWNPNNVLTTCKAISKYILLNANNPNNVLKTWKAISKGLANRLVYWSCALCQKSYFSLSLRKENLSQQEFALHVEQRFEPAQCFPKLEKNWTRNKQLLRLKRMSKSPHSNPLLRDLAQ